MILNVDGLGSRDLKRISEHAVFDPEMEQRPNVIHILQPHDLLLNNNVIKTLTSCSSVASPR